MEDNTGTNEPIEEGEMNEEALDRVNGGKASYGETESLRLQMGMDRVSKFMKTLSDIEKKASDTDNAINQQFK